MIQIKEFKIKAEFKQCDLGDLSKQVFAAEGEIKTEIQKKSKNCKWNEWKSNVFELAGWNKLNKLQMERKKKRHTEK